jgi:glycosyltransferase involved in cell wall biosynthesis
MTPRVSIITPLHNKGRYVGKTIESVLGQTAASLEMLVVENHSTDEGPKDVEEWARRDSRVRLIIAPPAVRGPGAARNLGVAAAKGEWVLFLDADDLLEPDYLEQRLSVLKTYPHARIIAGPWRNFYPDAPDVFEIHFPNGWRPPFSPPPDSIYAYSPWALHAAIVHREALGTPSPWLVELDGLPAEDNAFWFRVLYGKTIYWNDSSGALYRKETENSRDAVGRTITQEVHAALAILNQNKAFLESLKTKPTSQMTATSVRMLENLLQQEGIPSNLRESLSAMRKSELALTSLLDAAMAFRRLNYKCLTFLKKINTKHKECHEN